MPSRFEYERAVRSSNLPPLSRLLTLTLATWADVKTGIIPPRLSPSLSVLEEATGMDRSTVRRHLNKLEADGWVGRTRPDIAEARAKKARTRYRLTVPKGFAVPDSDGNELGAENTEARGTEPLAEQELGAHSPMPRGTQPLELGAQCTMTRGTVPPNSSYGPQRSDEYQQAGTTDGIPDDARDLVNGLTLAGVIVRWPFKGNQWFPVLALIKSRGTPALIECARKIAARTDVESAKYFMNAWAELPETPPADTPRPPLRAVAGGWQPYRNPDNDDVYDEDLLPNE